MGDGIRICWRPSKGVRRSQRLVDKDVLRGGCVGWGRGEGGRESKGEEEEEEEEEEVVDHWWW